MQLNKHNFMIAHKEIIDLAVTAAENPMADEAEDFANVMAHPKDPAWGLLYEEWIELEM